MATRIDSVPGDTRWDSIAAFLGFWLEHNPLTGPERAVFDEYYTNYRRQFSPYIRHHFAGQSREIVAAIRAQRNPHLLEVGAGCGTESLWFALQGADVTAIDIAADRLDVARARLAWLNRELSLELPVHFLETSLFDFRADQVFDLIWLEQTFHHLEPRERVCAKLASLIAPGGMLVISETNAWNPSIQLQLFMRRGFKTRISFIDRRGNRVEYGNERVTTPGALRRRLDEAQLRVVNTRRFRMLPNSDPPDWWLGVENMLVDALPFLATHFNVLAVKELGTEDS